MSQAETKDMGQANTTWYPVMDTGQKKNVSGKTSEIQMKFGFQLIVSIPTLIT